MAVASESVVQEGEILAGKYRVERVLGVGGMGVVVAAEHLQLGEKVALKFLLPEALQNPEVVARFEREARAAVRIKSEHVARVIDVGALPNSAPYMVMEYLDGKDLSQVLLEAGPLPVRDAVDYVLQACVAVAEAHSHGIIHRDLKPANLFRVKRRDGHALIKVLDFGISKLTQSGDTSASATKTTMVMGSPAYMSPEQMQSTKLVDERTDIWALGVILYELATGKKPFDGEQYADICVKVATVEQAPVATMVSSSPPAFDAVIRTCLAKRRDDRYANIGELARALAPLASKEERALVARIAGSLDPSGRTGAMDREGSSAVGAAPVATGGAWGQPTSAHSKPPTGQRGGAAVKIALGAVTVLAVAGVVGWRLGSADHAKLDSAATLVPTMGAVSPPSVAAAARVPVITPLPAVSVTPVAEEPSADVAPRPVTVAAPVTGNVPVAEVPTADAKPKPGVLPVAPAEHKAPAIVASPPPTVAATVVAATKPPAKVTGADPCSPDYFYDANGKKVFKKECFK